MQRLTYKFRLYPNKNEEVKLRETLELCRFTYNKLLEELNKQKNKDKNVLQHYILSLKEKFPNLNKVYSKVLQYENNRMFYNLRSLSKLKKKENKIGSLRFKGKGFFKTFTYNQSGFKIIVNKARHNKLYLSKIGEIPFIKHRDIEGKIKQITIKKCNSNKWFCYIIVENNSVIELTKNKKRVGLDLGIKNYIYNSDKEHIKNPKYLENSLSKLKKLGRKLSKKKKGSKNRMKAKIKFAKLHEKILNQRNDFLHKISTYYIKKYGLIGVEKLNINEMIKNNNLSRLILDSSWGKFVKLIEYKAESAGVQVIKVDARGTTQNCSSCGVKVRKKLKERVHNCKCGLKIDRDYNSSLNILKRATVGNTGINAWGNVSSETSMNQELQSIE